MSTPPSTTLLTPEDVTAALAHPDRVLMVQRGMNDDKSMPYPKFVTADGRVQRQDRWKGNPAKLAGFQNEPEVCTVDVDLADFLADPAAALGKWPVYIRADGSMFAETATPVVSIVVMLDERPVASFPPPAEDE